MINAMIVTIQCKDQVGLVAAISGLLARENINIVSMREFVDTEDKRFFARIELQSTPDSSALTRMLAQVLPEGSGIEVRPQTRKRLVVLVTKEHHCLSDLLIRHHFKNAPFEIAAVIGNYDVLRDITGRFGVPYVQVSHEGRTKEEFEAELTRELAKHRFDYVVLAKFMRILSDPFVAPLEGRVINIHHSFLPAFIGAHPYKQAYERGVKLIGATAHFVTHVLDEGPIITQQSIPVDHSQSVHDMIRAGREIETSVLAQAVRQVCEDRVFIHKNRTIVFA
jgi:formyltetrahydrofolate deformylase